MENKITLIDGNDLLSLNVCDEQIMFVSVPAGEFQMGSTQGLPLELPCRLVTVENSFYVSCQLVPQYLWESVMGLNPSVFLDDSLGPVENVSWDDAISFCSKLSSRIGRVVRLPSESEWEYFCRAGTDGEYFFEPNQSSISDYAWFNLNSNGSTHTVGQKKPNPWGLYDIVGNLWEWCSDVWHSDYSKALCNASAREDGLESQSRRVLRGGAWDMDAYRCRSAYRSCEHKSMSTSKFGLRLVIER